jgi:hypothetical protein
VVSPESERLLTVVVPGSAGPSVEVHGDAVTVDGVRVPVPLLRHPAPVAATGRPASRLTVLRASRGV